MGHRLLVADARRRRPGRDGRRRALAHGGRVPGGGRAAARPPRRSWPDTRAARPGSSAPEPPPWPPCSPPAARSGWPAAPTRWCRARPRPASARWTGAITRRCAWRWPPARSGRGDVKTIGLLGGMSWESTAEYYRLLNQLTRERLGGLHSAKCVLYSVDFAEIEQLQRGTLGRGRRGTRRGGHVPGSRGRRHAAALHQHHAQGRRSGGRLGGHPAAAPRRHHRGRRARGRPAPRRPAGHRVHHGTGFLRGRLGDPRSGRARPGTPPGAAPSTG